ncbi:hypothetical protein [Mumia flava]|uniref:hypothetical protein n=1 Tax=Mumia flava TaxID=1348852 RepID=UPI0012FD65C2|nr:hypothetical protein [Mumia flava]
MNPAETARLPPTAGPSPRSEASRRRIRGGARTVIRPRQPLQAGGLARGEVETASVIDEQHDVGARFGTDDTMCDHHGFAGVLGMAQSLLDRHAAQTADRPVKSVVVGIVIEDLNQLRRLDFAPHLLRMREPRKSRLPEQLAHHGLGHGDLADDAEHQAFAVRGEEVERRAGVDDDRLTHRHPTHSGRHRD